MRNRLILLMLLLFQTDISGQEEYTITQATFLKAEAAQVFPLEDEVSIQVEGLKPGSEHKLVLSLADQNIRYVEVSKLIQLNGQTVALFPPTVVSPTAPGIFHIGGNPGDTFGIAYRTAETAKWIQATIQGTPAPPDPPDPPDPPVTDGPTEQDLADLASIARATSSLNDPITARYIKSALENVQSLSEMGPAVRKALLDSMKEVQPPYKDWDTAFRIPLDAKMRELVEQNKVATPEHLKAALKAVTENFDISSSQRISNKITMYTRANCSACQRWKAEVYPRLQKLGWKLDEVYSPHEVPQFIVCDDGKCSGVYTGYMSINDFTQIVNSMRN